MPNPKKRRVNLICYLEPLSLYIAVLNAETSETVAEVESFYQFLAQKQILCQKRRYFSDASEDFLFCGLKEVTHLVSSV